MGNRNEEDARDHLIRAQDHLRQGLEHFNILTRDNMFVVQGSSMTDGEAIRLPIDPTTPAIRQSQLFPDDNPSLAEYDSGFKFGRKSETELVGVRPELVAVARLGLKLSTQDFMIFDGLRTESEQAAYVKNGTSKTMKSKHLKQADGFSWAFDAVPVVGTLPKWDWNLIYPVVAAIDLAATKLGYADSIRWGGAWDRTLADFGGDLNAYKREVEAYCARHPGKDFIDGPHFEWVE